MEAWCKFRKPARHGDLMEVTIWIGRRTQKSLLFHFEMRREGDPELAAEGHYTVVCVNRKFQSVAVPRELIELFGEYLPSLSHRPEQASEGAAARGSSAE